MKGLMSLEPRTDRPSRLVSIPPVAVALLSGLKVKQREERAAVGREWSESEYVFSHWDGRPFHPDTVSHAFAVLVKKPGLPHVRLHDLRHSHATLMMADGVNPKIVSARLGHASVVITLDTYSHALPGLQEEAALKLEEGLRKIADRQAAEDPEKDVRNSCAALFLAVSNTAFSISIHSYIYGAEGRSRTDTGLPPTVFETVASTIPPLRPVALGRGPDGA